jgi:RES domain-containing protein
VLAFRLTRQAHQALDGEGARMYGGRWNSEGKAAVYASLSRALAALEYLVGVDAEDVPDDLVLMTLDVPDDLEAEAVAPHRLASDWNHVPAHPGCVRAGDDWLRRAATALLRVPSSIVPEEANLVINPRHTAAARVRVTSVRFFAYDPRLLRKRA